MKTRKIICAILMIAVMFTLSCGGEETISSVDCPNGVFYGDPVSFNGATMRSFVAIDQAKPQAIGYEIMNSAFLNLPNPNAPEYTEHLIPLPKEFYCRPLPFTLMTFHWNPHGHDPMGVYTLPHFDFHFYTIPLTEKNAINASSSSVLIPPADCYIPLNYYGPTGPISKMGSHWVDQLAPEFNGGTFTKTFVYGSNNGKVIFHEPMATLAYLTGRSTFDDIVPIRIPDMVQQNGYYPTNYRITRDETYTYITLTDFIYRTTGNCNSDIM